MIRQTIIPLTVAVAALVLSGCATTRTVAGEPSPKEEGEAPTDVATAQAEAAAPEQPATAPDAPAPDQPAPPPAQAASQAPAPGAANFVPAAKQEIIGRVERVQFPAWVERGGVRASIKAGWAVYTADKIMTGSDGRVELSLAGEGRLKIGGEANVDMTQAYEFTGGNIEPSLLRLRRGSIEFSAPLIRPGNAGTMIELSDAIFANVMGGRLVARVDSEEALLGLVDAVVKVSGPKLNPGTMREPQTFLRVPRQGKAQAVTNATADRMARWLSQSAPLSGRPTLSADGTWDVSLNSGYSVRQLEDMACRIQRRGFPTEIYPVKEPGKLTWYRVVVRRFATKNDAVNFLGTARSLGSKEPWVLVPQS